MERRPAGRPRAVAAGGRGGVHRRLDHPGRRPGGRPGRGPGAGAVRGAGPPQPGLPRQHRARVPDADAGDRPRVRGRAAGGPARRRPDRAPADRPLRGPGRSEWMERLRAEEGNLAAAVRWYLAHDPGPLPHLFRVLWLFWLPEDLEREAWSWAEQVLPAAGTLDPQARAELAWAAAVLAVDVGDDAAALAGRQRLASLLAGISDPFLHAVAQLAMAWILPLDGDFGGALREAAVALKELRGQDEPVFTAMAV